MFFAIFPFLLFAVSCSTLSSTCIERSHTSSSGPSLDIIDVDVDVEKFKGLMVGELGFQDLVVKRRTQRGEVSCGPRIRSLKYKFRS